MWKDVLGYEGYYQASINGEIRRVSTRRILRGAINKSTGYRQVSLSAPGKKLRTRTVHILVCEAFHGARPKGKQAAHKDGNKLNNSAKNLSWKTPVENANDKNSHGTNPVGESHHRAKLTELQVKQIRRRYIPRSKVHGATALAKLYNVSTSTIVRVAKGKGYSLL